MSAIFDRIKNYADLHPEKIAVVSIDEGVITYLQLSQLAISRACYLSNIIRPSTRVALCLNKELDTIITVLALNIIKSVIIPLNPGLRPSQIDSIIQSVNADFIIFDSSTKKLISNILTSVKGLNVDSFCYDECHNDNCIDQLPLLYDYDQFLITLSSGSTGKPKPIVFSEKNKIDRFKQAKELYAINDNDVILCASPFFHSLGQRLVFLPLLSGSTLVYMPKFTAKKWIHAVSKYKVTMTIPVSSHLHILLESLLMSPNKFKSLRCLVSSSASINKSVKLKLFNSLNCDFHEMYGASEVATATSLNKEQALIKPDSVGFPCPGVVIKIINKDFSNCKTNKIGRIAIRSNLSSSGYYNLLNITKKSFVNGYFITGDLGYLDNDGFLYFIDRENDVIVTGGVNIYPSDIEDIINKHKEVVSSIVVGVKDLYFGEIPVAIITGVSNKDRAKVESELRKELRNKISSKQQPLKYFFRDKMPFSHSGKVDRKLIRSQINDLGIDLSKKLRSFSRATLNR